MYVMECKGRKEIELPLECMRGEPPPAFASAFMKTRVFLVLDFFVLGIFISFFESPMELLMLCTAWPALQL